MVKVIRRRKKVLKKKTFRSGLEDTTALQITSNGAKLLYETSKIKYTMKAITSTPQTSYYPMVSL